MYTDLASISISWRDFTASCTSTGPVVGLALIESKKHNRWERFCCCQHSLRCNQSMNAAPTAGFYSFIWFYFWNITNQLYSGWTWPLVKYWLHLYLTINFRSTFRPRESVKDFQPFHFIDPSNVSWKIDRKILAIHFFPRYGLTWITYDNRLSIPFQSWQLTASFFRHAIQDDHSSGIQQHRRGASPHNLALQIQTLASETCCPSRLRCRFELGSW